MHLWIAVPSTLFFSAFKHACKLLRPILLRYVVPRHDGDVILNEEARLKTSRKIEWHIYNFFAYSLLTVLGWFVVRDKDWLPSYLGGHGQFENSFRDMPLLKVDEQVLYYGLFSFGLRTESLFSHLFGEWGSDFEEMLLHDVITVFLFTGYIFSNSLAFGTMIVILHDASDIIFHFSKAVNASVFPEELAAVTFFIGQIIFAYMRIYCFPQIIYGIAVNSFPIERAYFNPWLYLNVIFLSILCCMHVLWFYMFQRINLQIISKV